MTNDSPSTRNDPMDRLLLRPRVLKTLVRVPLGAAIIAELLWPIEFGPLHVARLLILFAVAVADGAVAYHFRKRSKR